LLRRNFACETNRATITIPRPFSYGVHRYPGEKKMEKQVQNIQDVFLNNARKEKTVTTIYLMSGVKLTGRIKSFDKYSVILESNNQDQLIFKHAISTVAAGRSFSVAAHAPVSAAPESAS
jgi:host factor-I protein